MIVAYIEIDRSIVPYQYSRSLEVPGSHQTKPTCAALHRSTLHRSTLHRSTLHRSILRRSNYTFTDHPWFRPHLQKAQRFLGTAHFSPHHNFQLDCSHTWITPQSLFRCPPPYLWTRPKRLWRPTTRKACVLRVLI